MLKPKLKPGHALMQRPNGTILMGARVSGFITEVTDESGLVWPLCALLDGTRDLETVLTSMQADYGVSRDDVRDVLTSFYESGWLYDAAAPAPHGLAETDADRHGRTVSFFSTIEERARPNPLELIAILRRARVTVLGLGGVGCAVSASLAATGVGRIHCVDHDRVEISNLNRQLLFSHDDLGRPKTDVVTQRLRALDPNLEVTSAEMKIAGPSDAREAIAGSDVVLCCADTPADVYLWVNEACFGLGIPVVIAGYTGPKVSVGTYIPGSTACFACQAAATMEDKRSRGFPLDEPDPRRTTTPSSRPRRRSSGT